MVERRVVNISRAFFFGACDTPVIISGWVRDAWQWVTLFHGNPIWVARHAFSAKKTGSARGSLAGQLWCKFCTLAALVQALVQSLQNSSVDSFVYLLVP